MPVYSLARGSLDSLRVKTGRARVPVWYDTPLLALDGEVFNSVTTPK